MATRTRLLRDEHGDHRVVVDADGVTVDGSGKQLARVMPDGTVRVGTEPSRTAWVAAAGDVRWVYLDGEAFRFEVVREGRRRSAGQHESLTAPMPATVLQVRVAAGDRVEAGATLIILEAMKMELPVRAAAAGVVVAVHCREGDLVQPGVSLIEME